MERALYNNSIVHQRARLSDRLRDLLKEMSRAGLTYQEIADELDTSLDTIKNIVTKRIVKPRNRTLDRIISRLRRILLLNLSEDVALLIQEVLEEDAITSDFSPYIAFEAVFQRSSEAKIRFADRVYGEYVCYRYSGSGKSIIKSKLTISSYDERKGVISASLEYHTPGGNSRLIRGFVWPVGGSTLFLGAIQNTDDVMMMSIEHLVDESAFPTSGLVLYKSSNRKSLSARIACVKIQDDNRTRIGPILGHISYDRAQIEIGVEVLAMMRNNLDEYSVLKTFSDE